ncbi:transcriptional regulator [Sphingomonas sp. R647]|uniref:winged helix-turn-helix domain-containing protein n=1 Tax=Sphingomonas sp. R647 TaxID=2875233 RepID=UPI001CD60E02|nr:transcriptional regulator [Sphingomonas sp. R647]MCA1197204.1 transcriptional regulator [Sphingomonas sp. R647]
MESTIYRFSGFELDAGERQLRRDGAELPLNARYLDALILLVRERGQLVTKDRFMDAVWRGIPVTDEALTQCIRTLRRTLGDEAGDPRFIATVPKFGYRFVGVIEGEGAAPPLPPTPAVLDAALVQSPIWRVGASGTAGAVAAGVVGGLTYGVLGATLAVPAQSGALSFVLVLACITIAVAAIGGGAVAFGVAAAVHRNGARSPLVIISGALAGLIVGAVAKLLGIDAFALLLGRAPEGITGAPEGLALGTAVGLAFWITTRRAGSTKRHAGLAGIALGAAAGLIIALLGGRLLAGSIDVLTHTMEGARLDLSRIGALLGEIGFGLRSRIVTSVAEGALFGGFTAAGLWRGMGAAQVDQPERQD